MGMLRSRPLVLDKTKNVCPLNTLLPVGVGLPNTLAVSKSRPLALATTDDAYLFKNPVAGCHNATLEEPSLVPSRLFDSRKGTAEAQRPGSFRQYLRAACDFGIAPWPSS
jgi:hypothetical protein